MQVLDISLRRDFGFKHILWVYSGRRGIHCWVCDESARKLTDEQRGAVVNYFAIYKGQEKGIPKVALSPKMLNHPFVEHAYDLLLQHWEQACSGPDLRRIVQLYTSLTCMSTLQILEDQQLLTTQRTRKLVLKIIIEGFLSDCESAEVWDKKLTKAMEDQDEATPANSMLWSLLVSQVRPCACCLLRAQVEYTAESDQNHRNMITCRHRVTQSTVSNGRRRCSMSSLHSAILDWTLRYQRRPIICSRCRSSFYMRSPICDEVAKPSCMLQAPFCVHPKTGKVCVPISVESAHDFNPDDIPTLSELVTGLSDTSSMVRQSLHGSPCLCASVP